MAHDLKRGIGSEGITIKEEPKEGTHESPRGISNMQTDRGTREDPGSSGPPSVTALVRTGSCPRLSFHQ